MNIHQIKQTFIRMESVPCPLTDRLVSAGYQQLACFGFKLKHQKSVDIAQLSYLCKLKI